MDSTELLVIIDELTEDQALSALRWLSGNVGEETFLKAVAAARVRYPA